MKQELNQKEIQAIIAGWRDIYYNDITTEEINEQLEHNNIIITNFNGIDYVGFVNCNNGSWDRLVNVETGEVIYHRDCILAIDPDDYIE